jgi:mannosylglycoprotein endo-beta-mannosidase
VVTLDFNDGHPIKGPGFWKLNCHFLHNDADFITHIKGKINDFKVIHQNSTCNPNIIWDSFKCTIAGYCMEYCSRKKKERNVEKLSIMNDIEKVKALISEGSSDDDSCVQRLSLLEAQLNKIVDFETRGLIIRSRVRWMEEGEKSSKYFCNLKKRSCEKKNIQRVKNKNGQIITDQKGIMENINSFYQNLYSENNINFDNNVFDTFDEFLNSIDIPKLPEASKDLLDQPICKNELGSTLVSMKQNKTPGYDGLPLELYVVFWPDICDMLISSYNYSMENGILSPSQRNGIITLIPKKEKDPLEIKNYRPISLLTVDYKLFAKTLANKLKLYMGNLIDNDQSGFLKGRSIGNNIRLILDIIEHSDANDIPGVILQLDIEKAFDSVSHDFFI